MKKWLSAWTPEFSIAMLLISICGALLILGIDGEVKSILTLAAGWVFRASIAKVKHNGN